MDSEMEARFWNKVSKGTDPQACWLWKATIRADGYGYFRVGEKKAYAHRVAYELLYGVVPSELDLDHLCRVRNCVNPAHLEPVSRQENLLRGDTLTARNAAKTHCPQGHEYNIANTHRYKNMRVCRVCRVERDRKRQVRNRRAIS